MRFIICLLFILVLFSSAFAQERQCFAVKYHSWAIDKNTLSLLSQMFHEKDFRAARMLMLRRRAGAFKGGERVYIVSAGFLRHTFRFSGSARTLWTFADGIKCR